MKNNQKGIAHLLIILIIAIILALIAAGFFVYKANQDKPKNDTAQIGSSSETETTSEQSPSADILALDDTIFLVKKSDLNKLPENTPASFKDYMSGKLETPAFDGCISAYTVNKISSINISGSLSPVPEGTTTFESIDPNSNCTGGASTVWYLQNDVWSEMGFQAYGDCKEIDATTIASEFQAECYDMATQANKPNPNGTLKEVTASL